MKQMIIFVLFVLFVSFVVQKLKMDPYHFALLCLSDS